MRGVADGGVSRWRSAAHAIMRLLKRLHSRVINRLSVRGRYDGPVQPIVGAACLWTQRGADHAWVRAGGAATVSRATRRDHNPGRGSGITSQNGDRHICYFRRKSSSRCSFSDMHYSRPDSPGAFLARNVARSSGAACVAFIRQRRRDLSHAARPRTVHDQWLFHHRAGWHEYPESSLHTSWLRDPLSALRPAERGAARGMEAVDCGARACRRPQQVGPDRTSPGRFGYQRREQALGPGLPPFN